MNKVTLKNIFVAVSLRTQHDNLGDWLIIKNLINEIAKHAHVWLDVSGVPEEFYKSLTSFNVTVLSDSTPFSSCREMKFLRWASRLNDSRVFLLMSPGHFGVLRGRHGITWTIKCAAQSVIEVIYGISSIRFGASIEEIGLIPRMATQLYKLRNHIVFRDATCFGGESMPDLAVLSPQVKPDTGKNLENATCIMSFRNDRGDDSIKSELSRIWLKLAAELSFNFRIIPAYQVDKDKGNAQEIYTSLKAQGRNVGEISHITADNYESIYTPGVFVLSNRLHVSLTSLVLGATSIALIDSFDKKIKGAFATIGLEELCLQVREVDANSVISAFSQQSENRQKVEELLRTAREKCSSVVAKYFQTV